MPATPFGAKDTQRYIRSGEDQPEWTLYPGAARRRFSTRGPVDPRSKAEDDGIAACRDRLRVSAAVPVPPTPAPADGSSHPPGAAGWRPTAP